MKVRESIVELEDGGSDRWLWVERPSALVFVFGEIVDLPASCGSDAETQWSASVSVVDIESSGFEPAFSALRSCGLEQDEDLILALITIDCPDIRRQVKAETWLWLAQCMHDYGARSPMWDECNGEIERDCPAGCDNGWVPDQNNPADEIECEKCEGFGRIQADDEESESFLGLKAKALAEMKALRGQVTRDRRLDGDPVNAIGQSAREFAQGSSGLYDALRRQPRDSTIRRMYRACDKTLDGNSIPSDI